MTTQIKDFSHCGEGFVLSRWWSRNFTAQFLGELQEPCFRPRSSCHLPSDKNTSCMRDVTEGGCGYAGWRSNHTHRSSAHSEKSGKFRSFTSIVYSTLSEDFSSLIFVTRQKCNRVEACSRNEESATELLLLLLLLVHCY